MTLEQFFEQEEKLSEEVRIFESELRRKQGEYNKFVIDNLGIDLQGSVTHLAIVKIVQNVSKMMGEKNATCETVHSGNNQEPEAANRTGA